MVCLWTLSWLKELINLKDQVKPSTSLFLFSQMLKSSTFDPITFCGHLAFTETCRDITKIEVRYGDHGEIIDTREVDDA